MRITEHHDVYRSADMGQDKNPRHLLFHCCGVSDTNVFLQFFEVLLRRGAWPHDHAGGTYYHK